MSGPDLARLIDGAYAAALQEDLWEQWSLDLIKKLGGSGGLFWIVNTQEHRVERSIAEWGPARAFEEYKEEQHRYDPQLRLAATMEGTNVFVGLPGIDLEAEHVRNYMRWQQSIVHNVYHQTAVTRLGDGLLQAGISIHRHGGLGPVERADYERMQSIWPELKRAITLGYRHGALLQNAFWDGVVAGRGDQRALLVDERGRVVRLTHAAELLIAANAELSLCHGHLRCMLQSEQHCLDHLIARAIRREGPRSGAMRVSRHSGRPSLVLTSYPLQRSSHVMAPADAVALITIVDPGRQASHRRGLYREAFGLTEREADLAVRLMEGHSVDSAAAILDMAVPTARTHMRRLYEKTGATGLPAMVQLLTRFG
ncbi:helix-turn-helix transcriptional regulator [Novosphingobium terrae]|uniref:helix-turn-helix transcriptional regulator n=1 Tax=Novosphingobium terrae TaxID=2726189 RepID=UPI001981E280|nr:helix-turn-helix transcriptional regulator [Novosphingobium terrae]